MSLNSKMFKFHKNLHAWEWNTNPKILDLKDNLIDEFTALEDKNTPLIDKELEQLIGPQILGLVQAQYECGDVTNVTDLLFSFQNKDNPLKPLEIDDNIEFRAMGFLQLPNDIKMNFTINYGDGQPDIIFEPKVGWLYTFPGHLNITPNTQDSDEWLVMYNWGCSTSANIKSKLTEDRW